MRQTLANFFAGATEGGEYSSDEDHWHNHRVSSCLESRTAVVVSEE